MNAEEFPVGICVKVSSLRPQYTDLEDFLRSEGNVLVCRRGRVWITGVNGDKRLFMWKDSPWANPFKIGANCTAEECLERYETHLNALLADPRKKKQFGQLLRAKRIGCFCDDEQRCHRRVILEKLKQFAAS